MTLESTILCVDNSDYMRNGDYIPTRGLAQQDAINMICHSKIRSNPENNVGLITMADKQVLVTLTTDSGKIMNQMHMVQPNGIIDFLTSIKIAHLALKHRQGRNHKMRIIVFIGSPVEIEDKELVKIAKKLKKEKVNVDIVNFGETDVNTEKLTTFINTLNGKEGTGSHLVTIPPGPVLSEALLTSPIMARGDDGGNLSNAMMTSSFGAGGSGATGGSGLSDFEFGIDPNSDPELALALRVSMEEQRARQQAEVRSNQQQNENTEGTGLLTIHESNMPMSDASNENSNAQEQLSEEEMLLNQALAMSMGLNPSTVVMPALKADKHGTDENDVVMSDDQQIALALQMSLEPEHTVQDENMDVAMESPQSSKVQKNIPATSGDIIKKGDDNDTTKDSKEKK
ncbi:unnamed protein product [Gordionus sp. m RMFG-2023]|uniref:26S proteasome non-ATPase regulatory subunit 4-like isoform X2 n=1 Tax=Gordionus sp. m RMFG-2023 TaxID=3053472 RepID=UPI0030E361D5